MTLNSILVVEDSTIASRLITAQLSALGYLTHTAMSGKEAIAQASRLKPDLILMDIILGQGIDDGIDIAAQIQKLFKIPVIYLTGCDDEATLQRAKLTQPFGFIIKPCSERDLHVAIEIALYKHQIELQSRSELNELKDRFIAMASHEFRTPLSVILLAAETLESLGHSWPQDKQVKRIRRIKSAVQQITKLLNNMFSLSRAEVGRLEFLPTPLNLVQFCEDLVEEFQENLNIDTDKSINFVFSASGECDRACMDEKMLTHILTNLLSNAAKFSVASNTVWLSLECADSTATFLIQDRGIGIPNADLEHLFAPFHRGSNVNHIPGTGLGLAIAKRSTTLHNGEISVESKEGEGTTFTVKLPLYCPPTPTITPSDLMADS
jgi:signal transduction histidine kinase